MGNNPTRLDANESAFFKRQIEHIKSKSYDVKYADLIAATLIPVDTSAPSGSLEITYRSYSKVGIAKIISDYASDFPRVDIHGEEKTAKVRGVGDSYGYSIVEIRRAAKAGVPLEQKRANTARRASDELVDNIAWNGDDDYGLVGLIGYPGITEYTVPADGTGDSKLWSTKTPDQIVRDVTGMVNAIINTTNGKEKPDTLLLPTTQFLYINSTRMTGGDATTILQFIMNNNIFISRIEMVTELVGAGAGATNQMMLYRMHPDNLSLEIPQPYEQFDADKKGMEYVISTHQETGGVIVYYPLSIAFGDGI